VTEARNKAQEEAEDGEGGRAGGEAGKPGGSRRASSASSDDEDSPTGALASDEALAALRDKLSGGQS
jgi:small subunit ribosomal protein S1